MVIFATPDFGAGGMIFGLVLIAWAVVLTITAGGIILGSLLLTRGSAKLGWTLLMASCLLPIFFHVAPPHLFRLAYGSYPLRDRDPLLRGGIKEGMSCDEVQATLGPPHNRWNLWEQGETWNYMWEWYGAGFYNVEFGSDGRVKRVLQN